MEPSCEDVQRVDSPAAVDLPPPDAEESGMYRSETNEERNLFLHGSEMLGCF